MHDLIVLTGGAGFIGSCFLWKLNEEGENNIIVIDHLDSETKKKNLDSKHFTDYLEKTPFIRQIKQGIYPKNVQAIFHIGACSSTTEANAEYLEQNNYEYSKILAQWALTAKVPFYYASSAATYGDGKKGYSDEDAVSLTLEPLNLYGQSKQKFDLWLINNRFTDQVVGFKYFNVFGPNEYHKEDMRSLVVKAYEQIKRDGKIRLFKSYLPSFADGEQKRDFIYVKDAVNLMCAFWRNPSVKGIHNIGTGKARTWNDLAKAIFAALKLPVNIEYIAMPEAIKDRYQYFTEADLNKLNKSGIQYSLTSLENAVADYVINYLEKGFARL
ncbi:MAG: ADP-glyceromanno-heptose 6-epimerase [Candidatus Margulisbacteria bacterium]|nr:ADP-glyceromanno-heptose 6-epimerase [Candidatus Margulisiibacteriota bacterium]